MHRFASATLIDSRGWLLMQERDSQAPIDPDVWGFPGGGLEDGESFEQAAYRELAEETGVVLESGLVLLDQFDFYSPGCGHRDVFELYVAPTHLTEVECHEGRQMVFVDPAVLVTLPLTASAQVALPVLLNSNLYQEVLP